MRTDGFFFLCYLVVYRTLFGLKQMLAFLSQAVERKYQVVEPIYLPPG